MLEEGISPRRLGWTARLLGWTLAGSMLIVGFLSLLASRALDRRWEPEVAAVEVPTDAEAVEEGERLARIYGCWNGCHGEEAAGQVFVDEPGFARVVAPDLTRLAAERSTEDLVRAIRYGVRPDGRSLLVMPSADFFHLGDEDLGAILAFLRSREPGAGPRTEIRLGPIGKVMLGASRFSLVASRVDRSSPRLGDADRHGPVALGRYLARTACAECHGPDLRGQDGPVGTTPDLAIAAAYGVVDFRRFLRTGEASGGRELRLMSEMCRKRFRHFTDDEIEALHAYLTRLPEERRAGG